MPIPGQYPCQSQLSMPCWIRYWLTSSGIITDDRTFSTTRFKRDRWRLVQHRHIKTWGHRRFLLYQVPHVNMPANSEEWYEHGREQQKPNFSVSGAYSRKLRLMSHGEGHKPLQETTRVTDQNHISRITAIPLEVNEMRRCHFQLMMPSRRGFLLRP